MSGSRVRRSILATTLVAAAVLGGTAVTGQAATGCAMTVTTKLVASHTYRSGLSWRKFRVTARSGGQAQSAIVQLSVMPRGVRPRLVGPRLGRLDEVRDQVRGQQPRALAAINGDFFGEYRLPGGGWAVLPRHASVHRGAVRSSGSTPSPVVGVDVAGHPYAGTLEVAGTVSAPVGSFSLTGVNWRALGSRDVVVYTPAWAGQGASRPAGDVEWVLGKGGTITAVRSGRGTGAPVAPHTRVVAFGSTWASDARQAVVGSRASVRARQVTTSGVPLSEAVGRRRLLVEQGAVSMVTCPRASQEQRPRTTTGWDRRGRWMTLVAPGTGYDSGGYRIGGLGLPAMASVAQALGFRDAVELDGGGSTTSYVRNGTRWHRLDDSDTRWQRPVANGLAFVRP